MQQWLKEASNNYKVLPCNPMLAGSELHQLQVTTHSLLGAVLIRNGGSWLIMAGCGF
ncbi:DUF2625 domain-containing protein [Pantoea piersonii]|uniref:DUF2625 domain-containing protein n=1 Tax=Pantoea piersonii TaxID=2364647 RepID=A0AAJ5UBR2_9GAMM|nr:DUF2625 family protein [Pantoea piersonii]WBG92738.1 DUF2625 domain-containing protein [Pantoea piersonii]